MPIMQKANRVVEVADYKVPAYMEQGYSIIDANGNILEEAIPNDVGFLKIRCKELTDALKAKDKEIEKLKKALSKKEQ